MSSEEMTTKIVVEKAMKGILEVLQQNDEEIAALKDKIQSFLLLFSGQCGYSIPTFPLLILLMTNT